MAETSHASSADPKVEIVTITPALAEYWLQRNSGNRPLRRMHAAALASEMSGGRWVFNGDPIRFGQDGLLDDGQHRLKAVVISGVSIQAVVVHNLPPEAFSTIDIPAKRSGSDVLGQAGFTHTTILSAMVRVIDRYQTGRMEYSPAYTNGEIVELARTLPGIQDAAAYIHSAVRGFLLAPPSVVGACYYIFSRLDADAAKLFLSQLIDGTNLSEGDPVSLLRNRLISNATSKAKLPANQIVALVIKAWNYRRSGAARIRCLRWRENGDNGKEQFPAAK